MVIARAMLIIAMICGVIGFGVLITSDEQRNFRWALVGLSVAAVSALMLGHV